MATLLSPGVNVTEIDLTTIVPSVSTSVGAIAGLFRWGPVGQRALINSETTLVQQFGSPTSYNAETFFTAANFLSYTNSLYVVRAANTTGGTGNATFYSVGANTLNPNTILTLAGGGVTNLLSSSIVSGMYVTQSTNTSIVSTNTVVTVINSTAISVNANVTSNSQLTLYMGYAQTSYSALAVKPGTNYVSNLVNQIVTGDVSYSNKVANSALNFDTNVYWVAKYPGEMGNSLKISVVDTANAFSSNVNLSGTLTGNTIAGSISINTGNTSATVVLTGDGISGTAGAFANVVLGNFGVGDQILFGNTTINQQYMQLSSVSNVTTNSSASTFTLNFGTPYRLSTAYSANSFQRQWQYYISVGTAPGQSSWQLYNGNTSAQDELHIVVVDEDGKFTGTPGTILETFKGLSRATDAMNQGGTTNYYATVINKNSKYIWFANDRTLATSNTGVNLASSLNPAPLSVSLSLGHDGNNEANIDLATITNGYGMFVSKEDVTIDILLQGKPIGGSTAGVNVGSVNNYLLANYLIENVVNVRKDCVLCVSPDSSLTLNGYGQQALGLIDWRNVIDSSSYTIMDTGYKYQYDRYNDVYRWIPMNGDIGGVLARTDHTNAPWWSPAGYNRGQINNVVKLAYNPNQSDRDLLYSNGIDPVVTFPGQGTILFGDKTLQTKPSAFDRINVRRLFLVLERAISIAAKY